MIPPQLFIIATEFCERLAFYCISGNLLYYLQKRFKEPNERADVIASAWVGMCYVTPLLGGFLADRMMRRSRCGRLPTFIRHNRHIYSHTLIYLPSSFSQRHCRVLRHLPRRFGASGGGRGAQRAFQQWRCDERAPDPLLRWTRRRRPWFRWYVHVPFFTCTPTVLLDHHPENP